ncbi:MAG: hypothetical protein E7A72_08440 [Actinomyces urogenitalis]|uniref:hypothetical protein n=1 Tax=Actinomyces urogenitalis TaxID=103621 RepID=UPI00041E8B1C|nr:hypothetical protein [Actinomyces urogenitalis]MDK8236845.1 hypothetical protein [Actinomyces urogenitalis]MDK8835547.1 hypothetical protein [Actinomyces urogenitalis]MDU0865158.1 hypothetical protein [Actinomyces urogenitalis]MDU0875643.1 hypothetical protein [Actinomyces urogenitalis]MDU0972906.1 hypothetical protein [Actinomyces urogenitalis]
MPGPPPGAAGSVQARDLPDYAGRLEEIGALPLEERSAGLAAVHEELASLLREAEG